VNSDRIQKINASDLSMPLAQA